jgi:hypothetical protein
MVGVLNTRHMDVLIFCLYESGIYVGEDFRLCIRALNRKDIYHHNEKLPGPFLARFQTNRGH